MHRARLRPVGPLRSVRGLCALAALVVLLAGGRAQAFHVGSTFDALAPRARSAPPCPPRPPAFTSWTFSSTAPAAGRGAVTGFYGVVDGDADCKSSLDDDVEMGTVKLAEGK